MAPKNKRDSSAKARNDGAWEELPMGPLAGPSPGREPVIEGTVVLGVDGDPMPSDIGAGDGAYTESVLTVVGGAINSGIFCGPASSWIQIRACHFYNTKLN